MLPLVKNSFQDLDQESRKILGGVILLCGASKLHKRYPIDLIIRLVVPSLKSKQFLYYEDNESPIAFCNWAFLDDALLESVIHKEYTLKPSQWDVGEHLFFPEFIAPFGHCRRVITDLKNIFKDQKAHGLHVKISKDNKIDYRGSIYHSQRFDMSSSL